MYSGTITRWDLIKAKDIANAKRWANIRSKALPEIAKELRKTMGCNCDLDRWEPERAPNYTGHSWVCRIHEAAIAEYKKRRKASEI